MSDRSYLCIDQKSFYATVECVTRGLDPMKAKLVVADPERSQNTICLAVSPALKALGVKNHTKNKTSQHAGLRAGIEVYGSWITGEITAVSAIGEEGFKKRTFWKLANERKADR